MRRHTQNLKDVIELVIDEGRRPYATLQGRSEMPVLVFEGMEGKYIPCTVL